MTYDIDLLLDIYRVCKEYVPTKDRQPAADHVANLLLDFDMSESDIKSMASVDKYLKRAVEDNLGEEFDVGHDDEYESE